MHSLDEVQLRTEQVQRLTCAIHKWNSMAQEYRDLRDQIDQIQSERELLRIKMAKHHAMLDAMQKELRPEGPEIVWHEILFGPKPQAI